MQDESGPWSDLAAAGTHPEQDSIPWVNRSPPLEELPGAADTALAPVQHRSRRQHARIFWKALQRCLEVPDGCRATRCRCWQARIVWKYHDATSSFPIAAQQEDVLITVNAGLSLHSPTLRHLPSIGFGHGCHQERLLCILHWGSLARGCCCCCSAGPSSRGAVEQQCAFLWRLAMPSERCQWSAATAENM